VDLFQAPPLLYQVAVAMWPLDIVWTFVRGEESLWLRRAKTEGGVLLVENREHVPERSYFFGDLAGLIRFERELVSQLEQSGWSLADFAPERRSSVERRHTRAGEDRRRRGFHPKTA
jgi:hypothetical protein